MYKPLADIQVRLAHYAHKQYTDH